MSAVLGTAPIVERIVSLGGTQEFLEQGTDIESAAIALILAGTRGISAVELHHIAAALGADAHWLITGEPDPHAVTLLCAGADHLPSVPW